MDVEMKGPAVWSWILDRPGHSLTFLHSTWLLPTAPLLGLLSLLQSHSRAPTPSDFLIFCRNALVSLLSDTCQF